MFDSKKFISKIKPLFLNLSKKSKVVIKNLVRKAKEGKISKKKIRNVINALDESKATKNWLRLFLFLILGGFLVKKVLDVYDEDKSFNQNLKSFGFYIKKFKKRMKNHGC
jgi:hypothetical protein